MSGNNPYAKPYPNTTFTPPSNNGYGTRSSYTDAYYTPIRTGTDGLSTVPLALPSQSGYSGPTIRKGGKYRKSFNKKSNKRKSNKRKSNKRKSRKNN